MDDLDLTLAQRMYVAAQQLADDAADDLAKLPGDPQDLPHAMQDARLQAYGHVVLMLQQMLSVDGQLDALADLPDAQPAY